MVNLEITDYQQIATICLAVMLVCLLGIYVWISFFRWKTVKEKSKYYNNVLRLNRETNYNKQIGDVRYIMRVKSKAQFDRTHPNEALDEYLIWNRRDIVSLLNGVQENRRIYVEYLAGFNSLSSSITPAECRELHIDYNKFIEIERKLVASAKISIVQTVAATCYVEYTSPQGRNYYSKNCTFLESEIRIALKELDKRNAYKLTEEWRRKNERTKVTPSLRYDVMRRDGFRCCLCGRTAANGVELEVDHIIPVSRGGNTTYSNLQTLCRECNRGKGTKL